MMVVLLKTMFLMTLLLCVSCREKKTDACCPHGDSTATASGKMCPKQPTPTGASAGGFSGVVVEHINTAGYTYVLVDTGASKVWAVAPEFAVKPGDAVKVSDVMPMEKYHSKTLNRTFDLVYFTGSITQQKQAPASK